LDLASFGSVFNVSAVVRGTSSQARALGPADLIAMDSNRLNALFKNEPAIGYSVLRPLFGLVLERCQRYMEMVFLWRLGQEHLNSSNPKGVRGRSILDGP